MKTGLASPVSLLPLKHFTVRQVERQNLQKQNYISGERVGVTLGETKAVGNKLYYKLKITTQRREKGGWFDLGAGVYNNEESEAWYFY
jgi:hypothetical protein